MKKEIKEKIIQIIIDNLGAKKAAELSLRGWNFYKLADQILALFPEYAKEIVEKINYCDGGENCKCQTDYERNVNIGREAVVKELLKELKI